MTDSLREQLQRTLGSAYTVERELGGGGMSRVFVSGETRLKRKVVVKVLSPELAAGLSAERFEREIQLAASLQQANIVPIFSAGETEGLPYYTMPFVEGESVRSRLATGVPIPVAQVISILRDVVHALEYAHERGVVHRDIKPDNILLSGGTAVVTDFGIAKALSAAGARREGTSSGLTQMGTAIGTPAYMSPEQAAGDPDVDQRSDIYALGCVAYELLTGSPPFSGRSPSRTLAAQMAELPRPVGELRSDTPPALAHLIARCLEKEPSARPQNAREIADALSGVSTGSSYESMPASMLAGPGAFRRALFMYVVAFVFVAVLAKAAQVSIDNLPSWFFVGSMIVMLGGLPVLLFAGWAHRVQRRRALATPVTGGNGTSPGASATLAMKAAPHLGWSRVMRAGAYTVGGFVAIVGAFMTLRALGIGPAGSLMARQKWTSGDKVLVTAFASGTGVDTSLGTVVSELVRTELSQAKNTLALMPVSAVRTALQMMTLTPDTLVDLSIAKQIAKRGGVAAIVDGNVTTLGAGYIVTGRIVDPTTGDDLAIFHETANSTTDLIPAVQRMSRDMRNRMGESLRGVAESPRLDNVTTSSLDALKKYTAGVQAADTKRDYDAAIKLFREATTIDPQFGMAWRKLAVSLSNSGKPRVQIDSAATHAFELRERMTEHEKWLATGYYYQSGPHPDRAKAIDAYERIANDGPPDAATHNLAMMLVSKRDFTAAESLFRRRLATGELNVSTDQLINDLIYQGRIAAADSIWVQAAKRNPSAFSPLSRIPMAYLIGGIDSVTAILKAVTASGKADSLKISKGFFANLDLYHGKMKSALQTVRSVAVEGGKTAPSLRDSLGFGYASLLVFGDTAKSAGFVERGLKAQPFQSIPLRDRPVSSMVSWYASTGQPKRARAIFATYDEIAKDSLAKRQIEQERHAALAEILLAEKKPLEAIREFWRADSLPDGPASASSLTLDLNLARSFDAANMPDSAITYFEKFVTTPDPLRITSSDYDALFLAGTLRRLGELYEQKGERLKAIGVYEKFVTQWKDADPELQPQVAAIKARLDRLRKSGG